MDQPPSLDMVYIAVNTLYGNSNPSDKEKASLWLDTFQKSVYSWNIADQMLQEKRNVESCYFAAQTMRSKIQKSFQELPTEAHIALRDSLLNHISQINDTTNTIIVTQLCVALADLALQMSTWQKCTLDLINKLSESHLWPLLEILTVLPEELENKSVRLGANRRVEILEDLKSCSSTVIEFLQVCLNSSGDNTHINTKIIRCFTSWLAVQAIALENVSNNLVVSKVFQLLSDCKVPGALHDSATDCVCVLLQCLEDNNNQQTLELELFRGVISLEQPYHISVATEDQEKSMNYCSIFTELAKTFLDKVIINSTQDNHHFALKILDLVLICVGHHDYEVAEITFNLWYRLSEELYQKNNKTLTEMFRPYIERLITALCRHAQMEPDADGLLEDGDDFKDFRIKVSDLIKDVVFIIGSNNCFRQMFINLQAPDVSWDTSEAALFVMQAVAKNILPSENEIVPKVVEAILSLPENTHIAVRYTSVLLLGELCEWIEQHPSSLEPILNFLLYSLQHSELAPAAATALQNICVTNNEHLTKHMNVLLQVLHQIDQFKITNNAVIGILKGTAAIINCMEVNEITVTLREVCFLQISPLCEIIEKDMPLLRGTKTDPILWLDRLSSIFRNLAIKPVNDVHPCTSVVTEVWPVLSNCLTKYQSDVKTMEKACRCIRFTLRCLSRFATAILEPLVKQIVHLYQMNQHSCFLYLGSILVDEYAVEESYIQGLLDMLQAFINPTFTILKVENGLRNHPDTVDDFFRLCARFIQRAPVPMLQCPSMPAILQCALLACTLDHKEANLSVMKFFCDLIHSGRSNTKYNDFEVRKHLVQTILQDFGQQLMSNLLTACIFYLHSYMLCEVAEVFVELMLFDKNVVGQWLENAVKNLPNQNPAGGVHATHQQMLDFHVSVMRSDSSKSITHALKDFVLLYR